MAQKKRKLVIVDYGMGNIRSVEKACAFLGCQGELTADPEKLLRADKAILPGVGAFGDAMAALARRGLDQAIREYAAQGKPLLGICLGMQLMFAGSTEGTERAGCAAGNAYNAADCGDENGTGPRHAGFGFFPGVIRRFKPDLPVKVPHVGWNAVKKKPDSVLLEGLPAEFHAYFVHSYMAADTQIPYAAGLCRHGAEFVAAAEQGRLWGVQFHPEKSGDPGLRILYNFLK